MAVRNSHHSMRSAKIGNQGKLDVWLVECFRAENYLYTMTPLVHLSDNEIPIDISKYRSMLSTRPNGKEGTEKRLQGTVNRSPVFSSSSSTSSGAEGT